MKNVVIISGGNGSGVTANACKTFLDDIRLSAVIPMADSGGANGKLRESTGFLPASDLMRATIALSKHDTKQLKQIFYRNRIADVHKKLDGFYIGILWYACLQEYGLSFIQAQRAFEQIVDAVGHAYPVTLENTDLCVELSNGDILKTEGAIDRPPNRDHRITKAWFEPSVSLYEEAQEVIAQADVIIFGPGSLYTSIIPSLLVDGMKETLETSKAKLVYILGNAYEEHGEAGPRAISEFVSELEVYLPRPLDHILYNNHILNETEKVRYAERQWTLIDIDDTSDSRIISADFERFGGLDSDKLGYILKDIIF